MSKELFIITTLSSHTVTFAKLVQKVKCKGDKSVDKRYPADFIQRFCELNKRSFQFLHISVYRIDEKTIIIETSEFCGRAPLFSPISGKPVGEIHVTGKYREEFSSFLQFSTNEDILEFNEELPVNGNSPIKAPIEYTCAQFINELLHFPYHRWRKFSSEEKIESRPTGGTQWHQYARAACNPAKALEYPNRRSILFPFHKEWQEMLYVLSLAFDIVTGSNAPMLMRHQYMKQLSKAKKLIREGGISATEHIRISKKDRTEIQQLKESANAVLSGVRNQHRAWRFNCALLYERYVQYVFECVAIQLGGRVLKNPRFPVSGTPRPAWALAYLEPDMILNFPQKTWVVDAKYKSHMLNIYHISETLKETFRADFHQIMAYSSVVQGSNKEAFLVYPAEHNIINTLRCMPLDQKILYNIHLLGLKIDYESVDVIARDLAEKLINK